MQLSRANLGFDFFCDWGTHLHFILSFFVVGKV